MAQGIGISTATAVRPTRPIAVIDAASADTGLETRIAGDEMSFAALEGDWRALEARLPAADLFCSFDWAWCWWRHFGARERARPAVITLRMAGRLVAVMPLAVMNTGPYGCAVLMGAGSGHYGDILVDRDAVSRPRLHAALKRALSRIGADTLQAENVRDGSALAEFVATRRGHAGRAETSYLVKTADFTDFDAYLASRPTRMCKDLRRRRRRLADEGEVAYEVITDAARVCEITRQATALKREWLAARGLHGRFLSRPEVDDWLVEVNQRALVDGRLHLSVLKVGSRLAAAQIAYRAGDRLVGYFASFDVGLARHAVGKLLIEDHLRDIFTDRLELDLLPPADDYKREWGVEGAAARSYTVPLSLLGRLVSLVHNPRQRERAKRLYLNMPGAVRAAFAAHGLNIAGRARRVLDPGRQQAASTPTRAKEATHE